MENIILNIGCTTKNGVKMNIESMIDKIGHYTDCTITKTIGFYKGKRENSLKVEIYDINIDTAVDTAMYFARIFHQECVALTIRDMTQFIGGYITDSEFFDTVIDFENNIIDKDSKDSKEEE